MLKNTRCLTVAVLTVCLIGYAANVCATAIRLDLTTVFWEPAVLFNENSEALATDSLAMLFWTSSSIFVSPEAPPHGKPHANLNNVNPTSPLGGDILLATLPSKGDGHAVPGHITNEDYAAVSYASADYGVDLASGYVYVVAFNLAYTTYQSVGVPEGTFYSLTPLQPFNVVAKTDIALPDDVGVAITEGGIYTMVHQTIPEPGTMVLFAIGSVAFLGLRRRFKRS